jgi:dihydrofolate reductase
MSSSKRKIIVYIAMSLDGYIAKPNGELDFLEMVEQEGEDYGYSDFISGIDTVIMGRKTYEKVLSFGIPFPHNDKSTYIITRSIRPNERNILFYNESLKDLITELKAKDGKHVFVDGGAEIVNLMLKDDLIDSLIISIIPVILGKGVALFKVGLNEQKLRLVSSKSFKSGLVQLHYERI